MDWPTVLDALQRLDVKVPPFNARAEAWLRRNPDLKGFSASRPVQDWADWLCAVWVGGQRQSKPVPPFPSSLSGRQWRVQADQAEDRRGTCPADDWLTVYVAYLHATADLIDELRGVQGWKVQA